MQLTYDDLLWSLPLQAPGMVRQAVWPGGGSRVTDVPVQLWVRRGRQDVPKAIGNILGLYLCYPPSCP